MTGAVSESGLTDASRLPFLFEVNPDGSEMIPTGPGQPLPARFVIPPNVTEVGTDPALQQQHPNCLLLPPGPFLFPRHCVLAFTETLVTVTPSHREAETFVNQKRIFDTTIVQVIQLC